MPKLQHAYIKCHACKRMEELVDGKVPSSWESVPNPQNPRLTLFRCPQCVIGHTERAFIRGYAIAVASVVRRQITAEDLLRSIGATEKLLKDADVSEFDLVVLRPALRKIRS